MRSPEGMMNKFEECCTIAFNAFDGAYGWLTEVGALILLVVVFNFFVKVLLKKLHQRLNARHSVWTDSFVRALYKPLSYFIWFFAILRLIEVFFERAFESKIFSDINFISLVGGVVAVIWFVFRWKHFVIEQMVSKQHRGEILMDRGRLDVIDKLITMVIIFVSVLTLMELFGLNINTLIAFGGIGGLAIAFSSQEIIASFFGGMMIYLTQPFVVGDWIVLPEKGIEGNVEGIGWYMTKIRALDKRLVYAPNSMFSKIVVINPSRMSHRPIKEIIGLRYADKAVLKKVSGEIRDMLQNHPDIDQSMTLVVRFNAFGPSSLDIQIISYTKEISSQGYYRVREDLLLKILDIVHSNGADLAFQTTTLEIPHEIKVTG
jgi:MscS family membrane protein